MTGPLAHVRAPVSSPAGAGRGRRVHRRRLARRRSRRRVLHYQASSRAGLSLPAVIGALVVVGLLSAAVADDVLRAHRASLLVAAAARAPARAERALLDGWAGFATTGAAALQPGAVRAWTVTYDGDTAHLRVVRLGRALFQLDARVVVPLLPGADAGGPAAHRAQALLLAARPAVLPLAAAVVSGADVLGGGLEADGRDTLPPGWQCDPADSASTAAIAVAPSAVVEAVAVPEGAVVADDAALAESTYVPVAPDTLAPPLAAPVVHAASLHAPAVEPSVAAGGECVTGGDAPFAWGDPVRPSPCAWHHVVVRVAGDLVLPAGRGQGLLVVDGDLELGAGYEHWGVVIVHGRVRATASGDRVFGALLARGGVETPGGAGLRVRRSGCAVARALLGAGVVTPVTGAAWREWW